jgi:hypothetical protein
MSWGSGTTKLSLHSEDDPTRIPSGTGTCPAGGTSSRRAALARRTACARRSRCNPASRTVSSGGKPPGTRRRAGSSTRAAGAVCGEACRWAEIRVPARGGPMRPRGLCSWGADWRRREARSWTSGSPPGAARATQEEDRQGVTSTQITTCMP